jgi:hypothetical protein
VLQQTLINTLGKPELQSFRVKFWHKLDDIEHPNIRYRDSSGRCVTLALSPRDNFLGFCGVQTESQLTPGVIGAPLVPTVSKPDNVATKSGTIHSQTVGKCLDGYKFVVCHVPP